jgi:hypothetical protein
MSMNDPADQPPPSVLGTIRYAMRDIMREVMRELVPRIPWRAVTMWAVALGATFVIREVYDIFKTTNDYGLRSQWSTVAGLVILFCAGFQSAWRSRDWARGSAVTLVAILLGFVVAVVGDVTAVLVISTFHNLDLREQLYWAIEVPLPVMLMLGGLVGMAGAAVAVGLTKFRHRPVLQS